MSLGRLATARKELLCLEEEGKEVSGMFTNDLMALLGREVKQFP